jgi:hypothetical protein
MDCCTQGTVCFELIKGLPAAFVTLIIGVIAAAITYNQYKVAAAKLKLDLFERRFAIFQETWKILSEVVMKGTREKNYGLGTPFNNFLPEAKFLFGTDVSNYLDDLATNWSRLHGIEGTNELSRYAQEKYDLTGWFKEQADTKVKEVFGRYLNFERWT